MDVFILGWWGVLITHVHCMHISVDVLVCTWFMYQWVWLLCKHGVCCGMHEVRVHFMSWTFTSWGPALLFLSYALSQYKICLELILLHLSLSLSPSFLPPICHLTQHIVHTLCYNYVMFQLGSSSLWLLTLVLYRSMVGVHCTQQVVMNILK